MDGQVWQVTWVKEGCLKWMMVKITKDEMTREYVVKHNLNKLKKRRIREGKESWGKLHLIKEKQSESVCHLVVSDSL